MALAKRGLGRGLEALLVEVPIIPETVSQAACVEGSVGLQDLQANEGSAVMLTEYQQQVQLLLDDAEDLKDFIDGLASAIKLL